MNLRQELDLALGEARRLEGDEAVWPTAPLSKRLNNLLRQVRATGELSTDEKHVLMTIACMSWRPCRVESIAHECGFGVNRTREIMRELCRLAWARRSSGPRQRVQYDLTPAGSARARREASISVS